MAKTTEKCSYFSVWDGGYELESTCIIDLRTGIITSIRGTGDDESEVEHLDREYIIFQGEEFKVENNDNNDFFVSDAKFFSLANAGLLHDKITSKESLTASKSI